MRLRATNTKQNHNTAGKHKCFEVAGHTPEVRQLVAAQHLAQLTFEFSQVIISFK